MKPRSYLLFAAAISLFVFSSARLSFGAENRVLHVELRVPKSLAIDPLTRFNFGTEEEMEAAGMSDLVQREDGDFRVFEASYGLKPGHHRRSFIVYHRRTSKEPDQVFMLTLPVKLKPAVWTDWRRPDFCETNATSNFRFQ